MKYLSICSGIEAASVAFEPLGWRPLAFSEIEAFPRAVLKHHYPDTPCHGDFTTLKDEPWIVDADKSAFATYDKQRPRTTGDVLTIAGIANAATAAAAWKWADLILRSQGRNGLLFRHKEEVVSDAELIQIVKKSPRLNDSVSVGRAVSKAMPKGACPPSVAAGMHYVFAGINPNGAHLFFDRLRTGVGMMEGDPVLSLRNALIKRSGSRAKENRSDMAAWFIYAWNAVVAGRKMNTMRNRRNDGFPTISRP